MRQVTISNIVAGSQAEKLGLQVGDILLRYNECELHSAEDIARAKETVTTPQVALDLQRGQDKLTLMLKPGSIGVFTEEVYD